MRTKLADPVAAALALIGWDGLGLQFLVLVPVTGSWSAAVASFFSFFTILTNLFVAFMPPLLIDDDQNGEREAFYATGCGPRTITHQFDTPGRYLVICAFLPHFEVKMYGWVIVRDR